MQNTESTLTSSHLLRLALSLCERIVLIRRGLMANSMDQVAKISHELLRSKLR